MRAIIHPGTINGTVQAPPSKSMTQRAYAAALLHKGQTTVHYPGQSNDERAALDAAMVLGAKVLNQNEHSITLSSAGIAPSSNLVDVGESGLAARLFTPIAAMASRELTITGNGTLTGRAMPSFRTTMEATGVTVTNFDGYLPITVKGPLQPGNITIDASSGSQFLSGLLFTLAYSVTQPVSLTVNRLKSKPYIDLTLEVLERFGRPIQHKHYSTFYIDPKHFSNPDTINIDIEGDWSGAANLLVAGAITGQATVTHLNLRSAQADKAVIDVLQMAGASVSINGNTVVTCSSKLKGFEFDATDCPDLFPILAIVAACARDNSRLEGLHRLHGKESNRADSICEMLQQFGVPFTIEDDALCITGVQLLAACTINPYNDHRLVMAAAVGALSAAGAVAVTGAEAVNKSYPHFFTALSQCGVNFTIQEA